MAKRKTLPTKSKLEKTKPSKEITPPTTLGRDIKNYVTEIESYAASLPFVMKMVEAAFEKARQERKTFIDEHGQRSKKEDGTDYFSIPISKLQRFERLAKARAVAALAVHNVPVSFFVSLVSQYDAYLGCLLRRIFLKKSELLNASDRTLKLSELLEFKDLSAAREFLLEKEVETVIRGSHTEHFDWMENKFGLPLRKDLEAWGKFIELTERRNLFVHCDGVVSSQYLTVCRRHGCSLQPDIKIGDQLRVSHQYFLESFRCLFEIGVKLGHVLWRKLFPDELKEADESLVDVCYELLINKEYKLAKVLLYFATNTLKKHSTEEIRRVFKINLAIAHKWSGDQAACQKLLVEEDWSACGDKFKIATLVLEDKFSEAAKIMRRVGKSGEIERVDYEEWPVFREFRETELFRQTYAEVFGEEFSSPQQVKKSTESKASGSNIDGNCSDSAGSSTPPAAT